MPDNKIKLISIAGPTASGKTALSIEIAKKYGGEVISADSMQIYKYMDIATAKPTPEEMGCVPHHLIGFVEPGDEYSVAQYVTDASDAIEKVSSVGKLPVLVGGTGLYIDCLLDGVMFSDAETDPKLRAKLQDMLDKYGLDYMLSELEKFDPDSAKRLAPQRNPKRILRAMEIYYSSGVTMTEQNLRSKSEESKFDPVMIALNYRDREILYSRINRRVDIMIEDGLIEEARAFYSSCQSNTSNQAIGYKELKPYLDGEKTLEECIETLKRSTRRYAKRQLTWFMRNKNIKWFYVDDYKSQDEFYSAVFRFLSLKGFEFI